MLGRVDGPYNYEGRCSYVNIILHNDNGSVKNKIKKNYKLYLKEKMEGFHQYKSYIPLTPYQRRDRYFNKTKEDYNLPLVTEDNKEQFYYPNAHQIEKLPGYYYIPFEGSVYGINKEGDVIIIPENKILKPTKTTTGYYKNTFSVFYKSGKEKYINIKQHRILALLFKSRPDRHLNKSYRELEVNHIDGIKTNNDLDNLEWVTGIENMNHAFITGLRTLSGISKPVLAKNIITGEIKKYLSVGTCSKEFNISQGRLSQHLNSNNYGLVTVDNYIFKYDNDIPWPNRPPIVKNNRGYFTTLSNIVAKNIVTGNVFIYKTINDAAKKLNLNKSNLFKHIKKYGRNIPYKDYLFFNLDEFKNNIKH